MTDRVSIICLVCILSMRVGDAKCNEPPKQATSASGLLKSRPIQNAAPERIDRPFVIVTEKDACSQTFGMLMICPAHAHGTPTSAAAKLRGILKKWPPHRTSCIWVCRANQLPTLARFGPLVDRVVINPFCRDLQTGRGTDSVVWRGFDHPCINYLRRIRQTKGPKAVLACVSLTGERVNFNRRRPSFEEVKWMACAAIGAGFKGLVWRGDKSTIPWAVKLRAFESAVDAYAAELGSAVSVGWVRSAAEEPCSAVSSASLLFVGVLNPEYLRKDERKEQVMLPLVNALRVGRIELMPPKGVDVLDGTTLTGMHVALADTGGVRHAEYRFRGGGHILVFRLARHGSTASQQSILNGVRPGERSFDHATTAR